MDESDKQKLKINIASNMTKAIEGSEERVNWLAKPEYWQVDIRSDDKLWQNLTEDERRRLAKKMLLVQEAATHMLAGMVKGTIKYNSDGHSLDQWMAHLISEGADQMNYQMLLFEKYQELHLKMQEE